MNDFQLPARRRVFLMRHGDVTYFDASGRAIDPDAVPLNDNGHAQAIAAGRAFAAQQIRFDRVIVSGLRRTVETAQHVLEETRQTVTIETQPAWQEIRGGRLSGIPPADIETAFLRAFDGVVPEDARFLDGESIGALLDRVLPPISALREDASWDTVLLVLHGGVNRAILSHAITAGKRAFLGHLAQETGCINALDVGTAQHDWVVRTINHSPLSPLYPDLRNTTMEVLYAQYVRYHLQDQQKIKR